ncbi:MipA/OmpV family protein [Massilia putida]|uniref:MipA/OmpV family protein n=1 Tax=Massilia putida TaxID=1141883 RepID=UPI000951CE05|nr:MipA/OmpV family protein [Massilia putida]
MNKLLFLALSAACGTTWAQTPATNPMPDGSRDMYVGLGVQSAPRWDGTGSRKVSALPVLQVQWSNGLFISGMSAGMHLSSSPMVEYGPLLAVQPGRDRTGTGRTFDGIGSAGTTLIGPVPDPIDKRNSRGTDLDGMDKIGARLQGGVFANYYLTPEWRVTSSLLYGAGNDHDGARLDLGVQRLAVELGGNHHVSLSAGVTAVNRHYNQTYFGVTLEEASLSRFSYYEAGGGLQDAHVGVRWNWAWSPSWMLTSNLQAKRLLGSAANSPLVERSTNLTVSTAIAYRF